MALELSVHQRERLEEVRRHKPNKIVRRVQRLTEELGGDVHDLLR